MLNKNSAAQLIRIYPDSTFDDPHVDVIWPPQTAELDPYSFAMIEMYTAWNGNLPVLKATDGSFYFKVASWGNGFDTGNSIYHYRPSTGTLDRVTPENLGLMIESFKLDSSGRLYFTENGTLRTCKVGITGTGTVFRSNDDWTSQIRSFDVTKDNELILQTESALYRMKLAETTHEIVSKEIILGTDLMYYEFVNDWDPINSTTRTILEKMPTVNGWTSDPADFRFVMALVTEGDVVNQEAFLARVADKFIGEVSMKPTLIAHLESADPIASDLDGKSLYEWLRNNQKEFLQTYFTGTLWVDYLTGRGIDPNDFGLYSIGSFTWLSDGSLGAIRASWWGPTTSTEFYQILNSAGEIDITMFSPVSPYASKTKEVRLVGDVMYYVYDVLNGSGDNTGIQKIGSINLLTRLEKENILPASFGASELRSWAVSDDNTYVYAMGWETSTNTVRNIRINLSTNEVKELDTPYVLKNLTVIQ